MNNKNLLIELEYISNLNVYKSSNKDKFTEKQREFVGLYTLCSMKHILYGCKDSRNQAIYYLKKLKASFNNDIMNIK